MSVSDNRSIAKNTLFLYGRKIFTLVIALYTSRLLLQRLGVTDFGIYGLVGSVVAMFSALRGLFSSSIQRFINVAKGSGNVEDVNVIFSLGVWINRWIAFAFFVVTEIGGTVMVYYLDIPPGRLVEAYIVLQFSILTAVVSILTVPYDALIVANERFDAFSLFGILDSVLRLLVVVVLACTDFGRLGLYAGFLFIETVIIRYINLRYCRVRFGDESKYHKVKRPELLKEMTGFAGWQFVGSTAFAISHNGINFILNLMGGVVVNAARSIAYQMMSALTQMMEDLSLSFQPRTMMLYAKNDYKAFFRLICVNTKINMAVTFILAFPLFMLAEPVLRLWLGEIPAYSVGFVQSMIVYRVTRGPHAPMDLYFKSQGKIRLYLIVESGCLLFSVLLAWLFLYMGYPFYSVFIAMALCEIINWAALVFIAGTQDAFNTKQYVNSVVLRTIVCSCTIVLLGYVIEQHIYTDGISFLKFLLLAITYAIIAFSVSMGTLFSIPELRQLTNVIGIVNRER